MPSEKELIEQICRLARDSDPRLIVPIGDDAAVLEWPAPARLVVAKDVLVEGSHFRRGWAIPELLAEKSLAVNLSDLAAMGAKARGCLLGLTLPSDLGSDFAERFLSRFASFGRESECPLLGGDLAAGSQLHVSVTVLGAIEGEPWQRSGGRAGDLLLLVGAVGLAKTGLVILEQQGSLPDSIRSRLQLRQYCRERSLPATALEAHLLPRALLEESAWFVARGVVHAAIDVSDGLAGDVRQLAVASGLLAVFDEPALAKLSESEEVRTGRYAVLSGGEDYALVLAVTPEAWKNVSEIYPEKLARPIPIGELRNGSPGIAVLKNGVIEPLTADHYDHFS